MKFNEYVELMKKEEEKLDDAGLFEVPEAILHMCISMRILQMITINRL